MTWIIIILILVAIYAYDQNRKQPYKIIDFNEGKAFENQEKFLENLDKEIKMRAEQLDEKAKLAKIKSPGKLNANETDKWLKQIDAYHAKLKKNEKTKDLFSYIREINHLKDVVVPNFDRHYTRLNTRYKNNLQKLVEISDDYKEWYYYQARLFDPMNYELWNESSWDDQDEARTIISEINNKLGFDMKLEDANAD